MTTKQDKLYAKRDIEALDEAGSYFFLHMSAMTSEKLHSKSDIAAELAYRDKVIDELKAANLRILNDDEVAIDAKEYENYQRLSRLYHTYLQSKDALDYVAVPREPSEAFILKITENYLGLLYKQDCKNLEDYIDIANAELYYKAMLQATSEEGE